MENPRPTFAERAPYLRDGIEAASSLTGTPLFVCGPDARIRVWSREAERLTALPAQSVLGQALDGLDRGPGRVGPRMREWAASRTPDSEGPSTMAFALELAVGPRRGACFDLETVRVEREGERLFVGRLVPRPAGAGAQLGLVAESRLMREVLRQLQRAAASQVTTLVRGESGTGKELAARAIHAWSPRAAGPFVAINCAALSPSLLEAELFGHVRGAFTGADADRPGVFVEAHGGTLFLDEVGEVAPEVQVKLLRVLQQREVRPVGSDRARPVDVRLVTATNRDLHRGLEDGSIREDFYYRIRVFEVVLPPLRERRDDILPIARELLTRIARDSARPALTLAPDAERALTGHTWPGNVRELLNALEHASVMCEADTIRADCLPIELRPERRGGHAPIGALGLESGSEAERERVLRALEAHGWNRTATADALGIRRVTLWKKIRAFRLDEGVFSGRPRPTSNDA